MGYGKIIENIVKIIKLIFSSWTLNVWDIGVFKLTTISFGIILGAYFSDFFTGLMPELIMLFLVGWIYLLVIRIRYTKKSDAD
jgi:hypothetical protein